MQLSTFAQTLLQCALLSAPLLISPIPALAQQTGSPNGQFSVKQTPQGGFEIVGSQGQVQGEPISPKHTGYDKILVAWSPDSQKAALIAMRLKTSEIYVLGTQHNFEIPQPSLEAMKKLAVKSAGPTLWQNPSSYKCWSNGPLNAKWITADQLEVETTFTLALPPKDYRVSRIEDIRDCTFSYVVDLTREPAVTQLRLLTIKKSPLI